jgi:NADP-dependent 3-hydroxy acid dehydrogenase YdfG
MSEDNHMGRVPLVTGATAGMGRATAWVFPRHGAKGALGARRELAGRAPADTICREGGKAIFLTTGIHGAAKGQCRRA